MDDPNDDPNRPVTPPLVLVDPDRRPFWPLAATRPVADLLAGTRTFRARWNERAGPVAALLCDPEIAGAAFRSSPAPPRNAWPDPGEGLRVAIASWVPPRKWDFGTQPATYRLEGESVAWRLGPDAAAALSSDPPPSPQKVRDRLTRLDLPRREAPGRLLDSIWATVAANPALVTEDAADFPGEETVSGVDPFVLLGDASGLAVGPGVAIGPFVVLDVRDGPIVLDRGVRVEPHSTLRGPLYAGPDSVILGGVVGAGSTIGPTCKVRGEVEQTIVQGWSNKAHDGFVGHSAIGEWVNLGANTVTSDLKNTYGTVRVQGAADRVDTGLLKVGAFLGDHVKTGIGTLLTTGTRLGVGTHLFGGREISPARLPDFSWHDGRERQDVRWEAFERAARTAMARRDRRLESGEREILRALHAAATGAD